MRIQEKNKHIAAITVGLALILLIGAITFIKPFSKSEKSKTGQNASQVSDAAKKAKPISSEDLLQKMQAKDDMAILDIRNEADFAREHILDSKNLPIIRLQSDASSFAKEKTYVLVDDGGMADVLNLAGDFFPKNGFKNVFYLEGGLTAWKNGNNPTISAGDPNSFVDQSKVNYISSDSLKSEIASADNLLIIDLRKSNQFNEGHIKGAINIFLDDLEKRRSEIPLGKKIILYDNDGLWAFKGVVRLFDMNFFNTFALSDGLDTWKQKRYEIVK